LHVIYYCKGEVHGDNAARRSFLQTAARKPGISRIEAVARPLFQGRIFPMFVRAIIFAASVAALAFSTQSASADQTQIGTLRCDVAGGEGLILGSQRALNCQFASVNGVVEHYTGTITKLGVDIGPTGAGQIGWAVFAPATGLPGGALAGSYGGVTGSVTVGVGLGANVLVGASTIALQPVSLNSQTGLNVAAGIAGLSLQYVPPAKKHRRHRHHH
jgi:hypothetical protein